MYTTGILVLPLCWLSLYFMPRILKPFEMYCVRVHLGQLDLLASNLPRYRPSLCWDFHCPLFDLFLFFCPSKAQTINLILHTPLLYSQLLSCPFTCQVSGFSAADSRDKVYYYHLDTFFSSFFCCNFWVIHIVWWTGWVLSPPKLVHPNLTRGQNDNERQLCLTNSPVSCLTRNHSDVIFFTITAHALMIQFVMIYLEITSS